jgi:predicted component of type VI protein secretion system
MLLFLLNKGEPIALCTEQEFVLGRGGPLASKHLLDLSDFEAYEMGVSRSHALIKVVEGKYLLTDLNSANGTWINGDRIVPAKPHDLPSKSVIQLGRLKLIVIYSHPAESKKE